MCEYVSDKIKSAASESIPNKVALIRPADQTWINGYIRKLIRKRKRLYRKAKRSNSDTSWSNFKKQRNIVVSEIKKAKTEYHDNLQRKLYINHPDPKLFWKISKQLLNLNSTRRSLPTLRSNDQYMRPTTEKLTL